MADFIDQLLVSLSLDSSDFVSKSQAARDDLAKTSQASGKTAVAVQEQGKKTEKSWLSSSKAIAAGTDKVSASFEALARTALDVFAVFTSIKGAEEAVADITALNNSLRLTAQSTGVAADVIYGWRESVRSIGGDANSATAAITALATAGANWDVYRQTSAGKELSFMGVTAAMLKNPTDALMQLARARVQRHMSNADFEVIAAKVGVSGDMAHLLELPMAQIQAKLGKFTALGPSQSDINDASALTDQWVTLEDTVGKALQELYQDAAPFLKGCVAFLQKIADLAVKHPEIGGAAAAAGSVIAGAAGLAFTKRAISWLLGGGGAASKAARAAAVDELEAGGATIGGGGAVVLSTLAAGALVGFEAGNIIQTAPGHNPNLAAKGLPPDVEAEVRKDALKNHIDPDAAVDQFRIEGGGYNNVSPSGAFGPSQLMPGTAGDLGVAQSVDDPTYSWQANVDAGTRYMKQMQAMFPGDPDRALVAYNWGPGNAQKWNGDPTTLPAETQRYLAMMHLAAAERGTAYDPGSKAPMASSPGSARPSPAGPMYRSGIDGKWHQLAANTQSVLNGLRAQQRLSAINNGSTRSNSTHSETHIGTVVVQTKATDAPGIARDIKKHLSSLNMTNNISRGLA